jgi:putative ABC transport system permease protein
MILLGAFAVMSLLLAAIGAYGLVAQGVAHRMREIGIRLALGANPNAMMRDVAWQAVATGIVGAVFGCVAALVLARPLESLLYGVRATDAVSFVLAGVVLVTVTAVAALVPALRAARIDPIEVLRAD